MEATLLEAGEKGAPMDLGFAEGDTNAQNAAFPVGADAQRDQHGAIEHLAALADFFVTRIEKHIPAGFERPRTPAFEFDIEFGGTLANLGGADGMATELLDNGRDFAGGNALDIHFGDGQFEGLLAPNALLEGGRIEVQIAAHLGDLELDGPAAGGEGFGFETIGVAEPGVRAFIGLGLQCLATLLTHGFIDEQPDAFGEAAGAIFREQLQNGIQEFRIGLVGHVVVVVGSVWRHPNRKPI